MSHNELELLRSEIVTLENFLKDLSEDDLIERLGFEHRLEEARNRLTELEKIPQAKSLPLTFRGDPVDGQKSIDANFAATALKAFIDVANTIASSLAFNELKPTGPLPKLARSLRIVDTVLGSFGFELELSPPEVDPDNSETPELPDEDPYELAIETTFNLIDNAVAANEKAVVDSIAELHPRAASKISSFAEVLASNNALFAAEFDGKCVRLDNSDNVKLVMETFKQDNIIESEEKYKGVLLGILPKARNLEFESADGLYITGKISKSIKNILEFNKKWLLKEAEFTFRVVSGRTTKRFVLINAVDLEEDSDK